MRCQPSAWTFAQPIVAQTSSTFLVCQAAFALTPHHWIQLLMQAVYNDHAQLVQQQLDACVAQTQIPVVVDGWWLGALKGTLRLGFHE
jgi:hypothetical protein